MANIFVVTLSLHDRESVILISSICHHAETGHHILFDTAPVMSKSPKATEIVEEPFKINHDLGCTLPINP